MHPNPVLEINLAGFVTFANQAVRKILINLTPPGRLYDLLPSDWKSLTRRAKYQGERIFSARSGCGRDFLPHLSLL